jgi:pantoate--beta-alanine ligase
VQVFHDVLGLYDKFVPKFVRQFAQLESPMVRALEAYASAVDSRAFPSAAHSFKMERSELAKFTQRVAEAEEEEGRKAERAGQPRKPKMAPVAAAKMPGVAVAPGGGGGGGGGSGGGGGGGSLSAAARHLSSSLGLSAPTVVKTLAEWRALEQSGVLPPRTVGLVPTMGALHEGHLSLMRRAKRENGLSAASVFVNPKQFAAHEDLGTYPRPWEKDLEALTSAGVDFVFAPEADEMYPPNTPALLSPFIDLKGVDETTREGASRPLFFRGVATVVAKLLNITQPKSVYFGQKDGMQCIVVKRLIEDLNFNVEMVVGETVREADGLAMSSRNAYLSEAQRAAAPAVYAALTALKDAYCTDGERGVDALRDTAVAVLRTANGASANGASANGASAAKETFLDLDYLSLASGVSGQEYADGTSLTPGQPTLASIAVRLGTTRLIDNVVLGP